MSVTSCSLTLAGDLLVATNSVMERRWRISGSDLIPLSLVIHGREWLVPTDQPGTTAPQAVTGSPELAVEARRRFGVEAEALHGQLRIGAVCYHITIHPDLPATTIRLSGVHGSESRQGNTSQVASGIEGETVAAAQADEDRDLCERWRLAALHLHLTTVQLQDRTDQHDTLVHCDEFRLAPSETVLRQGCLFILEDPLTRDGLILLKHAPLPHARPVPQTFDVRARHRDVSLLGHGCGDTGEGYAWSVLGYRDGVAGRTTAMHALQRRLRPYVAGRDGLLLSNTWGDRNRDGRIHETFIAEEIQAGAKLGVDVVQIDDGWQRGITSNSVHREKGGVWQGFWASDAQFWSPHPQRFPQGLTATATRTRTSGMAFGLWFAPDSADDFANWQKDADTILALHREHGVNYVKIDGVKAHSKRGEGNLWSFFRAVLEATSGAVTFDLDVTAEIRPGYFGAMPVGPIFVENRYSDWHNYWPHATLRNLWQLSWWIDPLRLRVEFLNPARNDDKYPNDPLAPSRYHPAYAFASTMIASPLGWFEVSSLEPAFRETVADLITVWKGHRTELHSGDITPIGEAPDGTRWTGFRSRSDTGLHFLIFRELTPDEHWSVELPPGTWQAEILWGSAEIGLGDGRLHISMADPLSFAWVHLRPE
jgi:alpha-galactosidase